MQGPTARVQRSNGGTCTHIMPAGIKGGGAFPLYGRAFLPGACGSSASCLCRQTPGPGALDCSRRQASRPLPAGLYPRSFPGPQGGRPCCVWRSPRSKAAWHAVGGLTAGEQKANEVQARVPGQLAAEKSVHAILQDEPECVVRALESLVEFSQKLVTHSLGRTVIHAGPQQRPRVSQTF